MKCDQAPELKELRRQVSLKRSAPTVPIDVPVRESKANGAVENAVKRWQGQFRTPKSHLEHSIGKHLPKTHAVFQWMAWWAASLLNRVAIRSYGRTVFEHTTGHRMKTPMCSFGEAVVWRTKRHAGKLNKWDSEWKDGIFLGISGMTNSVLMGTKDGISKTQDYRRSPDGR